MLGGARKGSWERGQVPCARPSKSLSVCLAQTRHLIKGVGSGVGQAWVESLLGHVVMCESEHIFYSV